MNHVTAIRELVEQINEAQGDKPQTYHLAKILRGAVDDLVRVNQPGAGEFKWSTKAVKTLTKPSGTKQGKPSIIVARDGAEVWHTDGHYMKRGDIPKRFGDVEEQPMALGTMMCVIPNDRDDIVTVTGGTDNPHIDDLLLSNGATCNRLLLTYVMDGFSEVTLSNNNPLHPIVVMSAGDVVGLVMPTRKVKY